MSRSEDLPRPYFTSPAADPRQEERRLILVSWHFPPSQAAGALRWQKFSRFFAERGWGLDVIALDPDDVPRPDPARLEDLPPGVRAFGVPEPVPWLDRAEDTLWRILRSLRRRTDGADAGGGEEDAPGDASLPTGRGEARRARGDRPASFAREEVGWRPSRPRSWARAWWAWRQHARGAAWARTAADVAGRLVRHGVHRAIVSCGPPHMVHEAGRLVSLRTGLPFAMDLRDPWSLQQRLLEPVASPAWYRLAERLERRCVGGAGLVVCNTEPAAEAMRQAHPGAANRVVAVMNGYDEEPLPSSPEGGPFLIVYAGTIYLDRDPRPLFRASARVIEERALEPDAFRIELVGNVDDYGGVPIGRMAEQEGIAAYVATGPFLPRAEALELMARATVLVSLPQDSDLAIPSKIFEYMRFPAWILAMVEPGSATGTVLQGLGAADVVSPGDVDGLAAALTRRYGEYRASGRPRAIAQSDGAHLSRRRQAESLLAALDARMLKDGSRTDDSVRNPPLPSQTTRTAGVRDRPQPRSTG